MRHARGLVLGFLLLFTAPVACAPPRAEIRPPAGCPCGAALCERTYTQCGLEQDGQPDAAARGGSCGDRYVSCCFGGPGCVALGSTWMPERRAHAARAAHAVAPDAALHTVFSPDAGR